MRIFLAHETFARDFEEGVEDDFLGDPAPLELPLDHRLALAGIFCHGCRHGPPPDLLENPRATEAVPMIDQELRFTGSVPEKYERLMVPLIFRPYADELARRARALQPRRVLETAAGTGAVTRALHEALPDAEIVATDLNQPMLDVNAQHVGSDRVRFVEADAQQLPFEDGSFDLVLCQFGAMFFPDKVRGHAEAQRVLATGGHYLLAIWDAIERNPLTD